MQQTNASIRSKQRSWRCGKTNTMSDLLRIAYYLTEDALRKMQYAIEKRLQPRFIAPTILIGGLILLNLFLTGCNDAAPADAIPIQTSSAPEGAPIEATATPLSPTATAIPPTPTPQIAALVNGQPILLDDLERELARYEQAQSALDLQPPSDNDARTVVLNVLIEQALLRQAAAAQNISIAPDVVDARMEEIRANAPDFAGWLDRNFWNRS